MLLVEDFQPGFGPGDVGLRGVAAAGLLLHVIQTQGKDRQPIDRAAGRFRVQPRALPRLDALRL